MGLRCSLLGHDYGDTFVERDREERGNEVVVTERELAECVRCGAEKVTAENTEVRSLQVGRDSQPESSAGAPSGQQPEPTARERDQATSRESPDSEPGQSPTGGERGGSGAGAGADAGADTGGSNAFSSTADAIEHAETGSSDDVVGADDGAPADADGEDAVIIDDDAADEPGSEQWDEPAEPADPAADTDPEPEPEGDDVEFIGGDATDAQDRQGPSGGEPAASSGQPARSDEHAGQPEASTGAGQSDGPTGQAAEPGGSSTEQSAPAAGQPETAGSQRGTTRSAGTDVDRSRGEWPDAEPGDDEGFDAEPDAAEAQDSTFEFGGSDEVLEADTGFTSVGPLDNAERTEADDLDYTLYCPECGFEKYAGGSSLRAGDICPDCRKGYLAEDR